MSSNGAKESTGSPPTVRVRIAVAVNGAGKWNAYGYSGCSDKDKAGVALECLDEGELAEAVHFVEADVPLPVSQTVEGQVAGQDLVPRESEADA